MLRPFCWIFGAALLASACGSTSTESVTGPSAPKCTVSLAGPSSPVAAGGGAGTVTVTTTPECEWTAAAEASWISEVTPAQGQGSGQVQFQVAANPNGTSRESAIGINGQRAVIRQSSAPCQIEVAVSAAQFAASGGSGAVTVSAPGGCGWTASSNVGWLSVATASGSGGGTVTFTVAANAGATRSGTLTVGGTAITISQSAAGASPPAGTCAVSLQPPSTSMPSTGGTGSIAISTNTGCAWTASSLASWITLTPPVSGTGNGSLSFAVAANASTTSRTGTVNISGATFTVNQAGAAPAPTCTITINPTSQSVSASGTSGLNVSVSTTSGCAWTAVSNVSWLTVASGANGNGSGTVTLNVATNAGAARTGTVTIGGQTFTVNQSAAASTQCTYAIDPTSMTVGSQSGSGGSVAVTAGSGCTWTATSNAGWLQITSGASGSGSGSVTFTASSYSGSSRTGTLTIAGQVFTVTQVRCSTTLDPQTQPVPALGGTFSVSVNTQSGCGWQAVESLNWVTITGSSSGTGSGTVTYVVSPNSGGARSGSVAIGGQTLTINQAAVLP